MTITGGETFSQTKKSSILISGDMGYHGQYLITASSALKNELIREFESMGVSVIQGELDNHEKLVSELQRVDVVISRFVLLEFGNEVDRARGTLSSFTALLENKRKIRRAAEVAGIPHTYVAANSFAAVLNYKEDVAFYMVKGVTDPRVIIYQPKHNIVSQADLIEMREEKTGRTLNRVHVSEDEVVRLSETKTFPDNVPVAILHNIFIKGEQTNYQLAEDDLEVSSLYPEHPYASVEELLDRRLVNPPRLKLASFA